MRPHAIFGALLVASCSAFGTESAPDIAPGDEDATTAPPSDAAFDGPEGSRPDAEAADTSTGSGFCRTQANTTVCEDFDEGQVLAKWTVSKYNATFSFDTSSWASAPHSGRLVMTPSAEEGAFEAYRTLGPQSVIEIELDVRKRGLDERAFELYWPSVGNAQFYTSGKITLFRTAGGSPPREDLPTTPSTIPNDFVHVAARIDLVQNKVTYAVDSKTCYSGQFPTTFLSTSEVRFQLVSYLQPNETEGNIDMAWDNIVVRTNP